MFPGADLNAPLVHVYNGVQVHPSQVHRVDECNLANIFPADRKTLDRLQSRDSLHWITLAILYTSTDSVRKCGVVLIRNP